jgi:hypothetical protein
LTIQQSYITREVRKTVFTDPQESQGEPLTSIEIITGCQFAKEEEFVRDGLGLADFEKLRTTILQSRNMELELEDNHNAHEGFTYARPKNVCLYLAHDILILWLQSIGSAILRCAFSERQKCIGISRNTE